MYFGYYEAWGDILTERWYVSDSIWLIESQRFEFLKRWCIEQFGIDEDRWMADNCVFFFMQQDDFVLFKLTWL